MRRVSSPGAPRTAAPSTATATGDERAAEHELLKTLAIVMCDAGDLTDSLTRVLATVCRTTGWHYGQAWWLSPTRLVELAATWHDASDPYRLVHAATASALDAQSSRVASRSCSQRRVAWSNDMLEQRAAPGAPPMGVLGVPVLTDGEPTGALTFCAPMAATQLDLCRALASIAAAPLGHWLSRKRSDDRMRAGARRLRLLLEHAGEAVIMLDAQGCVETWTPAAERTFRVSSEQIVGRHIQTFYTHEQRAEGTTDLRDCAAQERCELEAWRVRHDGSRFWAHIVTCAVRDDAGQIAGYATIVRDLTEARHADQLRAKYARALEHSNRELEGFASVASHDLQEPLRKILAFGDRLRSRCGSAMDEKGRQDMDRISDATRRMQQLIDDLLTYSRVAGRDEPPGLVDLNQIARGVVSDLEQVIDKANALVLVDDLPTLRADSTQMRQLFQNLIGNAIKFQPKEARQARPLIKISCTPHEETSAIRGLVSACWQLRFEDNGIGFEEQHRERIFGMLQRLHGRGVYEGTGIGLAICRKIVERHGGTIVAESVPLQGTTFIVSIPTEQSRSV